MIAALLTTALVIGAQGARAQDVDPQTIYWPLVTDGSDYRRVPYPQEAGSLVVMAGSDVVLDVRQADVTYWPITREYLTDVSGSSPEVDGTFEIVDGSGTTTEVASEPFLLWYADGVGAGPARLVRGTEARELYQAYVRDAQTAAEAQREYQHIVAEHHAAVEAWLKLAATRPPDLPKPPPELTISEPEPYRAFATEPEIAAIVSLEPGDYTVRLSGPDGEIVPSTERRLVAFEPLAEGVGCVVRPADRWTQPAISYGSDERLYTTGRTDLYVQPLPVSEFRARDFSRLFRPQSIEAADPFLTVWVPQIASNFIDEGDVRLEIANGGGIVGEIAPKPYRVAQTSGRGRGYTIEEFAPEAGSPLEPDFSAIRIPRDEEITALSLTGGRPFSESGRTVRVVPALSEAWLYLAAALPLVAGAGVSLARRRRRTRRAGNSGGSGGRGGRRGTLQLVLGDEAADAVLKAGRT